MQPALFWHKEKDQKLACELCPQGCIIAPDHYGLCRVRKNNKGKMHAQTYGHPVSYGFDPIEKKPLYHFYPGKEIYSVGTLGCNFHCSFCQNYQISQCGYKNQSATRWISSEDLVNKARLKLDNIGISYTYNEPTVFYEYMLDTAILAHKTGMKNVMVSNGFINEEPLEKLGEHIDAFNIDLKAFDSDFYIQNCNGKLEPVLQTLKRIHNMGKHLELTFLLIPQLNDCEDKFRKMIQWITFELGCETVLHISRYFPHHNLQIPTTEPNILFKFYQIAREKLAYVYIGNLITKTGQNTNCSKCNNEVISRTGYSVNTSGIDENGNCKYCNNNILIYMS